MPILGGKVGPQVGKVGPKVAPREPKGPKSSPKASPGTPKKSLKNDPGPHLEERAAREAAGVPSGGKMTPKSMEKRLLLTPKICKKRPAFRLVFQRFWVGKPEAQYQKRASKAESPVTKQGRVTSNEKTAESPVTK